MSLGWVTNQVDACRWFMRLCWRIPGRQALNRFLIVWRRKKTAEQVIRLRKGNSHHPQAFHFRRTSRRFPVGFLEFVSRQVRARVHKQKPRSSSEREFLKKTLEFISCQTKDHLRFPLFKTQVSFKWNVICWKQKTAVCQPRQLSSYKRL